MKHHLLFVFLFLFTNCWAQNYLPPTPLHVIEEGSIRIPVFDYTGIEPIFQQENDTTYVINFWATWCIPCVKELPYFDELLKKYESEKISVKLVSLDFSNKVDKSLIPFLKKKNLQAQVLLLDDNDANTWINKVDSSWSGALPATVIYNKKKTAFFEKSFTFDELETEFLKIKTN